MLSQFMYNKNKKETKLVVSIIALSILLCIVVLSNIPLSGMLCKYRNILILIIILIIVIHSPIPQNLFKTIFLFHIILKQLILKQ